MVTGDHAGTAASVGRDVGLLGPEGRVVDGNDPRARDSIGADDVSVYARVLPTDKLDIVRAYQDRGAIVAVTGDGVNDAPALRQADIGVAMGRTGSDVAREAADMVITDDDLGTIVHAIGEGRRIYGSIRKVIDYLVAGNLSEVTVVIGALLLAPASGCRSRRCSSCGSICSRTVWLVALGTGPAVDRSSDVIQASSLLSWSRTRILAARCLDRIRLSGDPVPRTARVRRVVADVEDGDVHGPRDVPLLYAFVVQLDRPGRAPHPRDPSSRREGCSSPSGSGSFSSSPWWSCLRPALCSTPPR